MMKVPETRSWLRAALAKVSNDRMFRMLREGSSLEDSWTGCPVDLAKRKRIHLPTDPILKPQRRRAVREAGPDLEAAVQAVAVPAVVVQEAAALAVDVEVLERRAAQEHAGEWIPSGCAN